MGKRNDNRIIALVTSIDCSGTHRKRLGVTDMVAQEGESIVYHDEQGRKIETGEKVNTLDYDEFNSDAIIVNNKYTLFWGD